MSSASIFPEPTTDLGQRFAAALEAFYLEVAAASGCRWLLTPLILLTLRHYLGRLAVAVNRLAEQVQAMEAQTSLADSPSPLAIDAKPTRRGRRHAIVHIPGFRRIAFPAGPPVPLESGGDTEQRPHPDAPDERTTVRYDIGAESPGNRRGPWTLDRPADFGPYRWPAVVLATLPHDHFVTIS